MSKIRPIHHRKLTKVFELDGWKFVDQTGSHISYKKPGFKRRIVIPAYKEIPVFIIKNNLRSAQMSRERYFELLKKVK